MKHDYPVVLSSGKKTTLSTLSDIALSNGGECARCGNDDLDKCYIWHHDNINEVSKFNPRHAKSPAVLFGICQGCHNVITWSDFSNGLDMDEALTPIFDIYGIEVDA